jgi:glycosyltransferase involved in cell wall biosynthesis
MSRYLMLVSARADRHLRDDVRNGVRPCPEYLRLEERHGVELLDWSQLGPQAVSRSPRLSLAHTAACLQRLANADAVFSDGEHLGVPLALGMRARGLHTPHLMLGHHLTTKAKRYIFRLLKPQARINRVILHSSRQLQLAASQLGLPRHKLAFVPYGVDTGFWRPARAAEESLVVSVGRDHRDFATLSRACGGLPVHVYVGAGSLFSHGARHDQPEAWPDNFEVGFALPHQLRDWYARASVVVVPLVQNDFQAGVTVILEAMAMAKPVIVTATAGQRDVIVDGVTGLLVPPGDAETLCDLVQFLFANERERRRLGANARQAAISHFGMEAYADKLAGHLQELAPGAYVAAAN